VETTAAPVNVHLVARAARKPLIYYALDVDYSGGRSNVKNLCPAGSGGGR
jgi:hypothetical protein